MIRASSCYSICTNKPSFDQSQYDLVETTLKQKVEAKKMDYNPGNLSLYLETRGLKTFTQDFIKQVEKKEVFEKDELPDGAKNKLQEIWLEEQGFYDFSLLEQTFALQKGHLVEDKAIELINKVHNIHVLKNEERKTKGFLSGTCDMIYNSVIRDNKSPESWKSFRKKNSNIEQQYYFQLVAYKYLYDAKETWLDYTLMPTPPELFSILTSKMSEVEKKKFAVTEAMITKLKPEQRIKSYLIEIPDEDIEFLVKRLEKSEEYYNHLDFKECMNLN